MKRLRARLSADILLLVGLLVAFAIFSIYIALKQQEINQQQENYVTYSSHSAIGTGTLALYEWLGRLGYHPERIENQSFQISDDARVLFFFNANRSVSSREADYILQWVERGNTLFLSQENEFTSGANGLGSNGLLQALKVELQRSSKVSFIRLRQPMIDAPYESMQTDTFNTLRLNRNDYVEYANVSGKPIITRISYGQGTVWVSSAPDLFTNENLSNENNAGFALGVVSGLPRGSTIAFDEIHLHDAFDTAGTADSSLNIVYTSPWGWSIIFGIVLVFGYLALNGRRFGRVIPVRKTLSLRTPSEYVVSMANLFRRADKRGMILNHYRYALKRRLGRPFHLSPELSDERYIEMITRIRPEIDRAELTRILNSLRRTNTTEADLVKTVDQAVKFGTNKA